VKGFLDAHVHVVAPALLTLPGGPREGADGAYAFEEKRVRGPIVEPAAILAGTAADRVLLSPWVPLLGFAPAVQNESLAALASKRVDVLGTASTADELRDLMSGPFKGVEIAATPYPEGDFWAAAEETGALVFIHPTTRGFAGPADHYLWNTVGNPLETTVTAAYLVVSGVLDRHPGLKILLAHGGGTVLALRGRLRHASKRVEAAGGGDVDTALKRFYYDSITHDASLLRALVDYVGAGHVLAGSDHPFEMADPDPVATVRAAGLDPASEAAVLGGNAEVLLR
jgi:predicted TIM-barrel fold metal-dependent hydrolase